VLLSAWLLWFFLARVALYEVSRTARLESAPQDMDAPLSARLIRSSLVLDRQVKPGDVLIEPDAESFRLERAAEERRLAKACRGSLLPSKKKAPSVSTMCRAS
jgi:hypothetical protein